LIPWYGATGSAPARFPRQFASLDQATLTQPVDEAPDGPDWLHEIKFDGYRMHARLDHGAVRLLTRTGLDWTHKYPAIAAAVASLPATQVYLDGELWLKTSWEGFIWCNPPYGLHNGMQAWIKKFVAHRNGVILLPGYTYTQWFQEFIVETDCILFPLFKLNFINPALPPERRNSTLSNCLGAIGEKGTAALHRAARNGFGRLLVSTHPTAAAPSMTSDCEATPNLTGYSGPSYSA
jgi:hypothetical protein